MLTLNRNGQLAKFLWGGVISTERCPDSIDICALTRRIIFMFFFTGLFAFIATLAAVGLIVAPLVIFGPFPTPDHPLFFGMLVFGSASYLIAVVVGVIFGVKRTAPILRPHLPPKPQAFSKAGDFCRAAYRGWKDKFCPIVRVQ